jgi:hypothetical protein
MLHHLHAFTERHPILTIWVISFSAFTGWLAIAVGGVRWG